MLASLAVAALPGMVYWVWHASTLISISQVRASTITEVMGQVARFEALPANFLAFTLGLVFLSPLPGLLGGPAAQNASPAKLALGAVTFALAISLGAITNLRPIQADVAFKLAGQFNQSDSWQVAVEIYQKAIKLAPREDYYYLFLGQAYLETANTVEAGAQQENLIQQARDSLLAAQDLNPLNPDHTANLARLYNLWALMAEDPALRAERANLADRYFAAAVRLSPTHARLWDEWSLLQRDVFQNELRSRELLDQALAIDPQYDWTYALVGDLYLRQVSTESSPLSAEQSREILQNAAVAYQSALQYVDEDSTQSIATYKLALANVFRRLERYDEALSLLSDPILQDVLDPWRIAEQLGRIHQLKGELDEAQFYAQQALALAPEEQRAALQAWLDALGRTP